MHEIIREKAGREEITAYNTLMDMLQSINDTVGDIHGNAVIMATVLRMAAKSTDYGRIPEGSDAVTFGDAKTVRLSGKKHVYLADCEEGIFPAAPEATAINFIPAFSANFASVSVSPIMTAFSGLIPYAFKNSPAQ